MTKLEEKKVKETEATNLAVIEAVKEQTTAITDVVKGLNKVKTELEEIRKWMVAGRFK